MLQLDAGHIAVTFGCRISICYSWTQDVSVLDAGCLGVTLDAGCSAVGCRMSRWYSGMKDV